MKWNFVFQNTSLIPSAYALVQSSRFNYKIFSTSLPLYCRLQLHLFYMNTLRLVDLVRLTFQKMGEQMSEQMKKADIAYDRRHFKLNTLKKKLKTDKALIVSAANSLGYSNLELIRLGNRLSLKCCP